MKSISSVLLTALPSMLGGVAATFILLTGFSRSAAGAKVYDPTQDIYQ